MAVLRWLLLAYLLSACSPEQIAEEGELRVVSLSPSITGILLALGAGDRIVGVDRYSLDVPGLPDVPSLGGLFAPDLERAIELRPTLVLAVSSAQQDPFFAQLRARGVRVHEIRPYTLAEVFESYEQIARLVQRDARPLVQRVRRELEQLRASTSGQARPRVALVIEREPLYVAAKGTFVHSLIQIAGGTNVFGDLDQRYPQVSLELLVERAPDVVIDSAVPNLDPGGIEAARAFWARFDWPKRVEFIAPGVATLPGAALADGARLLRARIHPELAAGRP